MPINDTRNAKPVGYLELFVRALIYLVAAIGALVIILFGLCAGTCVALSTWTVLLRVFRH